MVYELFRPSPARSASHCRRADRPATTTPGRVRISSAMRSESPALAASCSAWQCPASFSRPTERPMRRLD